MKLESMKSGVLLLYFIMALILLGCNFPAFDPTLLQHEHSTLDRTVEFNLLLSQNNEVF